MAAAPLLFIIAAAALVASGASLAASILGAKPTGVLNSAAADGVLGMTEAVHAGGTAIALVTHDACMRELGI